MTILLKMANMPTNYIAIVRIHDNESSHYYDVNVIVRAPLLVTAIDQVHAFIRGLQLFNFNGVLVKIDRDLAASKTIIINLVVDENEAVQITGTVEEGLIDAFQKWIRREKKTDDANTEGDGETTTRRDTQRNRSTAEPNTTIKRPRRQRQQAKPKPV